MLSPRKPLLGVLLVLAITALALIFTSSALTKGNGPKQRLGAAAGITNETYNTEDVDVAAAVKPLPFCKKKQKSTKKHPCRKKPKASAAFRENPPIAGWKFGFFVSHSANGTWALSVRLTRTKGNVHRAPLLRFPLSADSVVVAPDLSSGTIDTGTQLGQFGAIKVTFGNPTGLVTGTAVPGCAGNWQKRTGALTGSIRFVADSTYFKTIVRTSMPTTLNANIGAPPTCATPPTTCTHTTFFTTGIFSGTANFFEAFNTAGVLSYVDFVTQAVGPATETHVLTETNLPVGGLSPGRGPVQRRSFNHRCNSVLGVAYLHRWCACDQVSQQHLRRHARVVLPGDGDGRHHGQVRRDTREHATAQSGDSRDLLRGRTRPAVERWPGSSHLSSSRPRTMFRTSCIVNA